jgi:uncharacterized protein
MTVNTKVQKNAQAFKLKDVAIVDGPFKHAMELNKEYLLQMEPDRLLARLREHGKML